MQKVICLKNIHLIINIGIFIGNIGSYRTITYAYLIVCYYGSGRDREERETQKEGIQAKKERGEWDNYGRPATMTVDAFAKEYTKVQRGEIRPFQLMKKLGMSKATYYRYASKIKSEE